MGGWVVSDGIDGYRGLGVLVEGWCISSGRVRKGGLDVYSGGCIIDARWGQRDTAHGEIPRDGGIRKS